MRISKHLQARIVLIGDDKQLPPFMYDPKVRGHELAGRPALSVAMRTGRVPVIELNEVYRAPPSLVAPYNRLAYGGQLVSRTVYKFIFILRCIHIIIFQAETPNPLTNAGIIPSGRPALLFVNVDGKEGRNETTMSLYNEQELHVLMR